MITRLHIENYVLIDNLDIDFEGELNIITGETGAGKSILLGAIGLLTGDRAETSVVGRGEGNCVVEAIFSIDNEERLKPIFDDADIDYSPQTVIRRVISSAGKSRAYVNDLPVQLATLKAIGEHLIDIHSQHQTLLLGSVAFQMSVLDSISSAEKDLNAYLETFNRLRSARAELEALRERAATESREADYIRFRFEELEEAKLDDEAEQEQLEIEQRTLNNATEIKEGLFSGFSLLSDDETNALSVIRSAISSLEGLGGIYPASESLLERLRSSMYEIKDISDELEGLADDIEANPTRLEEVNERLDLIYTLEQKHSVENVAGLIAIRNDLDEKLQNINSFEENISQAQTRVKALKAEATEKASKLTSLRKKAIPTIQKYVVEQLSELGMEGALLEIELTEAPKLTPTGADQVRFMFSANKGGSLEQIEKVASGGELSRLMLTLKSLIARHSKLPTIVFDEIDTGVSGRVADKMGEIMEQLSSDMQIINITHLPQVASKGSHHFFVSKGEEAGRTRTIISKLSPEERINKIAAMLSGSNITETAIAQAKVLIGTK